jgi:hypothetical protein
MACCCLSWSLTLREEHKAAVFENWVLRKIFWPQEERSNREIEEDYITRSLWSVLLTMHYSGDRIENNELIGACGTCGRQSRCIQGFG